MLTIHYNFSLSHQMVLTDEDHEEIHNHDDVEVEELPLKFEDIVDEKTYDKMRPPKPGGKTIVWVSL